VPAYPPASTTLSISSFVLGLVSIIFGFIVFVPLVGLVLGIRAVKKEPAARGFAIAGIWINAVMLGLVVIAIVIVMLLLVLGPSMAGLFTDASNTIPGTPA
jgi:hypothetical protein